MHCAQKMTHNIYWIGSNDWTTERFENLFPIPNGVSYNSYFIDDEKTCVVDSVDAEIREEYFDNLTHLLNGRELDYIVVNHMEPDHCQTLLETLERYPNCKMVGNATTFRMFEQFYNTPKPEQYHQIKEGDEICLGKHTLVSYTMPMVHWPEVTCTYEKSTGTLFSADAFGTFRKYKMHFAKFLALISNALLHFMVQSGAPLNLSNISRTNTYIGPAIQPSKKVLSSLLVPCMAILVLLLNNWLNNSPNVALQISKFTMFPKLMLPTSSPMLGNILTW